MSKLSQLTAVGRENVLPGYVLSPPRLPDIGFAEDVFGRWHMRRALLSAANAPPVLQQSIVTKAADDVRDGWFTYGMPGFDAAAKSAKASSLLLWLCVRVKHPQVTQKQCREMTAADPALEASTAVAALELFGFLGGAAEPKKAWGRRTKAAPVPSHGTESSKPSATPLPSADAA